MTRIGLRGALGGVLVRGVSGGVKPGPGGYGSGDQLRVVVADYDAVRREETCSSIDSASGLLVVAAVAGAAAALTAVIARSADVVVLDLAKDVGAGVSMLQSLRAETAAVAVVLCDLAVPQTVKRVAACGVDGFLLRGQFSVKELLAAVTGAPSGRAAVSPAVAAVLLASYAEHLQRSDAEKDAIGLTRRERETMELLVTGMPNALIASTMALRVQSVRNKVSSILTKIGVDNRAEATSWWAGHDSARAHHNDSTIDHRRS